jgi:hypothetical protein
MPLKARETRKPGFVRSRKPKDLLALLRTRLGQSYPQQNPAEGKAPLGRPLSINEVAHLIGCSPWTVRQTLIPRGLPFFRFTASGQLRFFENQVQRWIESQQEGGMI